MTLSPLQSHIWQHRDDDPQRLALSKMPNGWSAAFVAQQVDALRRLRHKVPAWYQPGLLFPVALSLEQASSERTARYKARLFSGKKMADLTGGLGVDTFFFAQHFGEVLHIEQRAELSEAVRHNFEQLGATNIRCLNSTAEQFLAQNTDTYDLVYLDPARRDGAGGRVFRLEDCQPNILDIKDLIFKTTPQILLKTAPLLDLRRAADQLGEVSRIWVVAADDECREVLYLLEGGGWRVEGGGFARRNFDEGGEAVDGGQPTANSQQPTANSRLDDIPICAIHLLKDGSEQTFEFTFGTERLAQAAFSVPQKYLYEPNPAVLKAGAFRSFAQHYGLSKLHPNTHLYTSAERVPDVPGRIFSIETVCRYDRKSVAAAVPEGRANIAVRNFPDSAEQVRQRLGLRDGGEVYLFAATDVEGKKVVVCRK